MRFERNRDIKEAIGIGLAKKLPLWMKNSGYSYKSYFEVWQWALNKCKISERADLVFNWIVGRHKTSWYGPIVDVSGFNNELLWLSIESGNKSAIRALFRVSGLFKKDVTLTLDIGTSEIPGEYYVDEGNY